MPFTEGKISDFSNWPPVIVKESRGAVHTIWGFLAIAFTFAAVRGYFGAATTAGRVGATVVMGALALGSLVAWRFMLRRPGRLEITPEVIFYTTKGGTRAQYLESGPSREAYIAMRGGRHPQPYLVTPESDDGILVSTMPRGELKQALTSAGWTYTGR